MLVTMTLRISPEQRKRLARESGLDASADYMTVYRHFHQLVKREQHRLEGKRFIVKRRPKT